MLRKTIFLISAFLWTIYSVTAQECTYYSFSNPDNPIDSKLLSLFEEEITQDNNVEVILSLIDNNVNAIE